MQKSLVKLLKLKTLTLFIWHSQFVFSFLLSYFKYERLCDHHGPENQRFFDIWGIKALNLILSQLDFFEKKYADCYFLFLITYLAIPRQLRGTALTGGQSCFILFSLSYLLNHLPYLVWSIHYGAPCNDFGSQSLAELISRVWTMNPQI